MKCTCYVSSFSVRNIGATTPLGLSDIFKTARKNNREFSITGLLSYKKGYYFQIIEGNDEEIDQLLVNISADSRHHELVVLFSITTTKRYFPGFHMQLLGSVNKSPEFIDFISENSQTVSSLDESKRQLLENFYRLKNKSPVFLQSYERKELKLLAWPDFTVINPSPAIIELCARLTQNVYPYRTLLEGNEFGSQQELHEILAKFDALDILEVCDPVEQPDNATDSSEQSNFYSKMKSFLKFR